MAWANLGEVLAGAVSQQTGRLKMSRKGRATRMVLHTWEFRLPSWKELEDRKGASLCGQDRQGPNRGCSSDLAGRASSRWRVVYESFSLPSFPLHPHLLSVCRLDELIILQCDLTVTVAQSWPTPKAPGLHSDLKCPELCHAHGRTEPPKQSTGHPGPGYEG